MPSSRLVVDRFFPSALRSLEPFSLALHSNDMQVRYASHQEAGLKAVQAKYARFREEEKQLLLDDASSDSLFRPNPMHWLPCPPEHHREQSVSFGELADPEDARSCATTVSYYSERARHVFPDVQTPYGYMADAWLTFEYRSFLGRYPDETRDDSFLLRPDKARSRKAKQWRRRRSFQSSPPNELYIARLHHRWQRWYGIRNFARVRRLLPQHREELRRRCATLFDEIGFCDDPQLAVEVSLAQFLDLVLARLRRDCARRLAETTGCCLDMAKSIVRYAEIGYVYAWHHPTSVLYRFRTELPRFRRYCPLDGHLLFFQALLVQAYTAAHLTHHDYRFNRIDVCPNTGEYTCVIQTVTSADIERRICSVVCHVAGLTLGICHMSISRYYLSNLMEFQYTFQLL